MSPASQRGTATRATSTRRGSCSGRAWRRAPTWGSSSSDGTVAAARAAVGASGWRRHEQLVGDERRDLLRQRSHRRPGRSRRRRDRNRPDAARHRLLGGKQRVGCRHGHEESEERDPRGQLAERASGRDDRERRHPRTRDDLVARSCGRWPDAADRRRTGNRHHLHLQPGGIPQRALHRHGWHSAPGARADVGDVDGVAARRGLRRAADRLVASDAQRQDAEPRARQGVAGLEHRAGRGGHGRRRRDDRRRSEQQRGLGSRLDRERAAAGTRRRPRAEDLRRSAAGVHGDGAGVHDPRGRRRCGASAARRAVVVGCRRAPSARTPRS